MAARPAALLAIIGALGALSPAALAAGPVAGKGDRVAVFPVAGSRVASPQTQISLRGIAPSRVGRLVIRGSRSGLHGGRTVRHSDGRGLSLIPRRPFTAGEQVTVRSALALRGAQGRAVTFTVAHQRPLPPPLPQTAADTGDGLQAFRSRPDLRPPRLEFLARAGDPAGRLFVAPRFGRARQYGALIADDDGEAVWYRPTGRAGISAADLRVQRLGGESVLTWWEGVVGLQGVGIGRWTIADRSYRRRTVVARNGYSGGQHDIEITRRGTAVVPIYNPVRWDLRPAGGPADGTVIEAVLQEIDLRTGAVLFEWHSLDHVGIGESTQARTPGSDFDYFHVNAVDEAPNGDLVVSARHTNAAYRIDRDGGRIVWRLGGRRSDFTLGPGAAFALQHDVRAPSDTRITMFDNGPPARRRSRGLVLALDTRAGTARLVREYAHPSSRLSFTQGSFQTLANGRVVIGWGEQPFLSEFGADGSLRIDARLGGAFSSYRALRFPWSGRPGGRPAIAVEDAGGGLVRVFASWNGATEIARWRVLTGSSTAGLRGAATAARSGFETAIAARAASGVVAVAALDRRGRVLGTSRAVAVP